jgi:thioredoxin 1
VTVHRKISKILGLERYALAYSLLEKLRKTMAADLAINTAAEFQEKVLNSDVPVLVDFWAPWCGPCKQIGPSVEELATEYAGKAKVFKLDVDVVGEVAQNYGIMSIPALLVFKGGKVVDKQVGAAPEAALAGLIDRAL